MGAFRDFFTELWNNYIKKPIDSVKEAIPDITAWWEEKVKDTFEGIKDAIPDINKWWEEKVKSTFDGIKDAIPDIGKWWDDKVKGIFTEIKDKIDTIANNIPKIDLFHEWSEKVFAWMKPKLIEDLKTEIAIKSIKEEYFQTDEVKEIVRKLKEKWKHSPGTASDIAHDLLEGLVGKVAKLQLQGISGIKIDEETPYSQRLFDQLAIITDISLAAEIIGIIGEILSIGQIDKLGEEIRAYLDYSGLSQLAGYGYGMILSSVLSPVIEQEIRKKSPVIPIDVDRAVRLAFRKVLTDEEFKEICLKQGYNEKMQSYLKEAYKYYPSPTDFIRFATRDVFREDIVKKYGYDSEWDKIESGIKEYVEKAGIDLEVLKWYASTLGFTFTTDGL